MAKKQMDYLSDADGDLLVVNGDWAVGESTYRHQRNIIITQPGEYKASPSVGVGVTDYIDGKQGLVKRAITQQFMQDGMEVEDLSPNPAAQADNVEKVFNNAYYR